MKANALIARATAYAFFTQFILVYPVYNLVIMARGASVMQLSILQLIWILPILILEIPSGALADILGRKPVIVAGNALRIAAYLVWMIPGGLAPIALGFILWGLEEALCSGAEEALLYDGLKALGQEHKYLGAYGSMRAASSLGVALASILGGVLYARSGNLVLPLSGLSLAGAIALVSGIREERAAIAPRARLRERCRETLAIGAAALIASRRVVGAGLYLCLVGSVYGILDEFDQLLALEAGTPLALVGLWVSVRYLAETLGAYLAGRLPALAQKAWLREVLAIACAGIVALLGLRPSIYLAPLWFLAFATFSALEVSAETTVQEEAESAGRATSLSMLSFIRNVAAMLLVLAFGLLSRGTSVRRGLVGFGILTATLLLANLVLRVLSRLQTAPGPSLKQRAAREGGPRTKG